jgi:hypothetical protein
VDAFLSFLAFYCFCCYLSYYHLGAPSKFLLFLLKISLVAFLLLNGLSIDNHGKEMKKRNAERQELLRKKRAILFLPGEVCDVGG